MKNVRSAGWEDDLKRVGRRKLKKEEIKIIIIIGKENDEGRDIFFLDSASLGE